MPTEWLFHSVYYKSVAEQETEPRRHEQVERVETVTNFNWQKKVKVSDKHAQYHA